tara:strand:+ start:70 stop:243 length:174 start_codon:yes stop_codon:yes gene_type:complete
MAWAVLDSVVSFIKNSVIVGCLSLASSDYNKGERCDESGIIDKGQSYDKRHSKNSGE